METFYCVYKITNILNGKIYIGIHRTSNLEDDYMGSGNLIKLAIKKYGRVNFKKEYLLIADNEKSMLDMESKLVNEDFIKNPNTYNMCVGGMGGNGGNNYHILKDYHTKSLEDRISLYNESPKLCEYCNNPLPYEKRISKYCGHSCSATHINLKRGSKKEPKIIKPSKKETYKLTPLICKQCGDIIPYEKRSNQFCGRSCKAIYTNSHRYK